MKLKQENEEPQNIHLLNAHIPLQKCASKRREKRKDACRAMTHTHGGCPLAQRPQSLGLMDTWEPKEMEWGDTKALLLIPSRMDT